MINIYREHGNDSRWDPIRSFPRHRRRRESESLVTRFWKAMVQPWNDLAFDVDNDHLRHDVAS